MSFPRIEGFVVTERLGSGSYSTVYKAYTKVGARSVVAIKCVDKSRMKHSESAVENLITEIRLLKTLKHPHIVQMKDFSWDDRHIFIVTEYCGCGDLSKYIKRCGRLPERQVLFFLQQLASALKFLRDRGIAHMDLKPHNLLLNKNSEGKYTLKVADFGFAQYMSSDTIKCSIRGSPLYMAPEMLTEPRNYDASVDLWSVGVIMYECLFGKAPYSSTTFKELMDKITSRQPIEIPARSLISPGCQDLLSRLLQHDPLRRITHEDFFNHQYLDLQHMPSKENYEKAVLLIRRAIEADSKRQHTEALDLYCESLRYLVPVVNSEADAVRRSALRAKVTRYMQRAEELKALTQLTRTDNLPTVPSTEHFTEHQPTRPQVARPNSLMACFSKGGASGSFDCGQPNTDRRTSNLCNCTKVQMSKTDSVVYTNGCSCREDTGNNSPVHGNSFQENVGFPTRNDHERILPCDSNTQSVQFDRKNETEEGFGGNELIKSSDIVKEARGAAVPYLENYDSSIVEETGTAVKPKKTIFGETQDACRVQ